MSGPCLTSCTVPVPMSCETWILNTARSTHKIVPKGFGSSCATAFSGVQPMQVLDDSGSEVSSEERSWNASDVESSDAEDFDAQLRMRLATADAVALACPPLTPHENIAGCELINLGIFYLEFGQSYESGTEKGYSADVQAPARCKGFSKKHQLDPL